MRSEDRQDQNERSERTTRSGGEKRASTSSNVLPDKVECRGQRISPNIGKEAGILRTFVPSVILMQLQCLMCMGGSSCPEESL